jgi:hypothetical protein
LDDSFESLQLPIPSKHDLDLRSCTFYYVVRSAIDTAQTEESKCTAYKHNILPRNPLIIIMLRTQGHRLLIRGTNRLGNRQGSLLQRRNFARREAPLPPLSNPVEQAIAAAQQRGELNNLSGAGKPLKKDTAASISHRMHSSSSSSANLMSSKAEFEMRRAVLNKELELEHMHGQAREYKGTSIVSMSLTGGDGGSDGAGDGADSGAMGRYILKQAQPSVKDLKGL